MSCSTPLVLQRPTTGKINRSKSVCSAPFGLRRSSLISSNSLKMTECVDHIYVLDRLTCDYLMPEAEHVIKKSHSTVNLGGDVANWQPLNFRSSMLSDFLPNTLSYSDISKFMSSPVYQIRRRGSESTFDKQAELFRKRHQPQIKSNKSVIDLTAFFQRDQELLDKKQKIADTPPPKTQLNLTEASRRILSKMQSDEPDFTASLKSKTDPFPKRAVRSRYIPTFEKTKEVPPKKRYEIADRIELDIALKQFAQDVAEVEAAEKRESAMEPGRQRLHVSARTRALAERAEERRRQKQRAQTQPEPEPEQEKTKSKQRKPGKMPGYLSLITEAMKTRELRDDQKPLKRKKGKNTV